MRRQKLMNIESKSIEKQVPSYEIQYIFYQFLQTMGNFGCERSNLQNPTSYSDILIIRQLKQTGDQLFMSSLEKYKDYVTNKNYYTLMENLKMQLEEKRKSVHDNIMNGYSKNQENLKKGQMKYNQQLSIQVDNSAKQLYIISQTIDAIIKQIDKQFEESKSKHDGLKNEWKNVVEKIMSNKKMKKQIKQDIQQQREIKNQSSEIVQKLKIEQNVKKIVSISEVPEQQINEKEKEGVIETQQNAIKLKLERQLQRQKQKHEKQMMELKKQIIRNNIQSNQSLKAMTMQNEKKQQQLMKLNEQLNLKIKDLIQQIEEKDKKIQQLLNTHTNANTNTNTNANSQHSENNTALNAVQTTFSNLKNSFRQKDSQDIIQSFSRSFRSSQIQGKFLNSKVITVRHKNGISYRSQIDNIFNPIHIYASTIMFSFDHTRPNNMDEYVKDQNDLLFVAKLENGIIIGGFSKNGFKASSENLSKNLCFIFSIHPNGTFYKLQLKCQGLAMHSVKLDSRFLKFGSNEIRVTCGKLEGICNVSTSSCIFESKDEKSSPSLKDFIGTGSENFKIKHYEIFKLHPKYPQIQPTDESQTKFNPFLSQIAA